MNIDITVPETLSEITLQQFQKYVKLITDNEPSEFVNQKTVEIFCNIKLKDIARIRIADVTDIINHLNELLSLTPALKTTFKLGKTEFGFIPKLEDITSGEFIDLENYLKDTSTFHNAMAVLYRPIVSKVSNLYQIEEYKGSDVYADVMKYAPLDVVLGSIVFFYTLHNDCVKGLKNYILQQANQEESLKSLLEKNGDGINQFTQQLEEIFSNLNISLNYQSHN